jgi:hypothetical protein
MDKIKTGFPGNLVFAGALVVCAAVLAWPRFMMSGEKRSDYLAVRNAVALNVALIAYAQHHQGVYPEDSLFTGGSEGDILTKDKLILEYPANPFSRKGDPVHKVPFNRHSPGDFSYRRDRQKNYEYDFVVYGSNKTVFERRNITR